MTEIIVLVLDVNDNILSDATVIVQGVGTRVTGPDGRASFTLPVPFSPTIDVEATGFERERVVFAGQVNAANWNNSLVFREVYDYATILTFHLGRLGVAPTKPAASVDLSKNGDAQAALTIKLGRAPSSGQWDVYREVSRDLPGGIGQTLEPLAVWKTDTMLLPATPDPTVKGWQRFTGGPADPPVDPMASGRFFWLLNHMAPKSKASKNRRFAVAVWSPDISQDTPLESLDMVVLFSPTTTSFTSVYPFGVRSGNQDYISLGARYFFDDLGFVYQLLARGRKAVVVMPICHQGDRGPYDSSEGIFRLCREVALFLHRECRTSSLAVRSRDTGGVPQSLWYSGGSLRSAPVPGIFGSDFGPIPTIGRVAVAGFSNGIGPVKQLMARWGLTNGYAQRFWGCPYIRAFPTRPHQPTIPEDTDPSRQWDLAWRELWDLDGFHPGTGGWSAYCALLNSWAIKRDPSHTRMVRLLHQNPQPIENSLWEAIKKEDPAIVIPKTSTREVHGGNGDRWRIIHLDPSIIDEVSTDVLPLGWDDHRGAAKIAICLFAGLSQVG